MAVLLDFSRTLSEMGFIRDEETYLYKHATGTMVVFVPTEGAYELKHEQAFQVIVHEDIWLNRKTAVINRLTALIGNTNRVHGRQCRIKRIDGPTAQSFLNQYHTGGFAVSYFKYGLYFRDELVAVGLFSKCRTFQNESKQTFKSAELTRYACKTGIRIVGGIDKIISLFCHEYDVYHIMTYADKEWTDGKSYLTLGFEKVGDTPPLNFRVHKLTGQRIPADKHPSYNMEGWVLKSNLGNLKLIRIKNPRD
ncbi:MAG: hypothetical protein EBV15_04255 [Bacteroidetes bacterium]|nr:hypothetical protein [Bacteroidota bacterium]